MIFCDMKISMILMGDKVSGTANITGACCPHSN